MDLLEVGAAFSRKFGTAYNVNMDSAIHLALAHPHEVLEFAITMLAQHRGMTRPEAINYIATHHADCRHGRDCPWMPSWGPGWGPAPAATTKCDTK